MLDVGVNDLVVFLVAAGFVVPAARRLRINPILGFLAVGIAVGPYGLAQLATLSPTTWLARGLELFAITNLDAAHELAELGVMFLLFMIALELPLERLVAMRRLVFGLGMLQVALTAVVIGGTALVFGNTLAAAVLLGGALALSSTAIVSQHLLAEQALGTRFGQVSLGVLLAQDLAVVPLLFLLGAFSLGTAATGGSEANLLWALLIALGKAVVAVTAIVTIGRLLIRPVFRLVNQDHSSEVLMATTLLVISLTAMLTHAAGLSAALGAFLAGLLLAETEYRHEIELIIEPLKGLLLGLFFVSVGMNINLVEVAANPGWIVLSVIGLLALKTLITAGLVRIFGFSAGESLQSGMMLAQGGEFAFVIVGGAVAANLIADDIGQFMLIVVSATMVLTPLLIRSAAGVARAMQPAQVIHDVPAIDDLSDHVILVGYGRTGKLLAELLTEQERPWLSLDLDAVRVAEEQARGAPLYLGDASRAGMLQKVRLEHAAAVVICTDDQRFSEGILHSIRNLQPTVPVLMRVHGSAEGAEFVSAGATVTVPEVLESGLQLAMSLFDLLGMQRADYADAVAARRSAEGLRQ